MKIENIQETGQILAEHLKNNKNIPYIRRKLYSRKNKFA